GGPLGKFKELLRRQHGMKFHHGLPAQLPKARMILGQHQAPARDLVGLLVRFLHDRRHLAISALRDRPDDEAYESLASKLIGSKPIPVIVLFPQDQAGSE